MIYVSYVLTFLFGSGITFYFVTHPEKIQKWGSIIGWLVSRIYTGAEYFSTKWEIEGKMNSFVSRLDSQIKGYFPFVKIKWTAKGNDEIVWEDGQAVIVMRDRGHRNKNFVHAAYFFTSEVMLKKSERHLSKSQKTSLDLFATQKLIEQENRASLEQFMNNYLSPSIEKSDAVRSLIQQYVNIDKIGVFFPVLIQELIYLGNKIFLEKPTDQVIEEVKLHINFLERFSQREEGDKTVQDEFVGRYCRCAIKIIASWQTRERGDVLIHADMLSRVINRDFENIYIIGRTDLGNKQYMNDVVTYLLEKHKDVELVRSCVFKGQIKHGDGLKKVETYFIHIHNPNTVKYFYKNADIEAEAHHQNRPL